MNPAVTLGLIGALLVVAFLANRVFRISRIPDSMLLMALGVVLGPVLGLVNAEKLTRTTNLLGTLAIVLILFEGGLDLNLRNTLRHFPGSLLLSTLSYTFSSAAGAFVAIKMLHLGVLEGLLVGSVLGCTSSTVVMPVLQQLETAEPVRATLLLEAAWGDVLAVLTVGVLLNLHAGSGPILSGVANGLLVQVGVALIFGVVGGILWSRLLLVLSEQRFWQVLTFSIVLVLFAGMEAIEANGLIAVLAFGLTLSNFPGIDPRLGRSGPELSAVESQEALLNFHSELAFLVRSFFFVLIGAVANLGSFRRYPLLMVGTIAALLFARWVAVQCSRWSWRDIDKDGRELILWMLPRGLITVVLAVQVLEVKGSNFAFITELAFAVILVTNFMAIIASVRAKPVSVAPEIAEVADEGSQDESDPTVVLAPISRLKVRVRKWRWDALLLVGLVLGGVVLWYGKHGTGSRGQLVRSWIAQRIHH
jgi:cell volume regulation protein A